MLRNPWRKNIISFLTFTGNPLAMKPDFAIVPEYFKYYIDLIPENDVLAALNSDGANPATMYAHIAEDKGDHAYADGKWTVKEVIQHMIDTERIFCYRALTYAREKNANLPGYDHDAYVDALDLSGITMKEIIADYVAVRQASITLYKHFSEAELETFGHANEMRSNIKTLGFMIVGHQLHHSKIIEERYL